ncbi:MAG: ABC transporter permease [Butyrivibrio sp.]|nr:ABC transporter permease [Butyrivibrio sp.]
MKRLFEKISNSKILEKMVSDKKRNIRFIILVLLLLISLILKSVSANLVSGLYDQLAADRWSDGRKMGQASLFFTEDQKITEDTVKKLEYEIEKKLSEAGIEAEEEEKPIIVDTQKLGEQEDTELIPLVQQKTGIKSLYADCFSAQGLMTFTYDSKVVQDARVIGVSGDFFLFHPLQLVSGSYFSPDDLMKDRIVIDETMAWELFGSTDVVGQMVYAGDVPHYVAGVIHVDKNRISKAAGLNTSYIYTSYESLCRYGTILSGRTSSEEISETGENALEGGISCIEMVAPNPVDGLLVRNMKEACGIDDKYLVAVDNTDRYKFLSLLKVMKGFGLRSMWDKPIFYPYWENIARAWEDNLSLLAFLRALCLIFAFILAAILVVDAYRNKKWTVRSLATKFMDYKYDLEASHKQKIENNKTVPGREEEEKL